MKPRMVNTEPELVGAFGVDAVTTGASYERADKKQPTELATVRAADCGPNPSRVAQETAVYDVHAVVAQPNTPTWIVAVTFTAPKFKPRSVRGVKPLCALFAATRTVSAGESNENLANDVPTAPVTVTADPFCEPLPSRLVVHLRTEFEVQATEAHPVSPIRTVGV